MGDTQEFPQVKDRNLPSGKRNETAFFHPLEVARDDLACGPKLHRQCIVCDLCLLTLMQVDKSLRQAVINSSKPRSLNDEGRSC